LFTDKQKLLELSNAVNGTDYTNAEEIRINTLSDENGVPSGIFLKIKNDISFMYDVYLSLYEHQSTVCKNLPLRMLLYISELFKDMYERKLLYRKKAVELPVPQFYVFYNGGEEMADREEYCLSDQYKIAVADPALELKVVVLNINAGRNRELMEKCREVREYSEFVRRAYEALQGKDGSNEKQAAMAQVIDECIAEDILADFLRENRRLVMMSSILEYDEQAHMEAVHDDGYDEGYEQGASDQKKLTEAECARADAEKTRADAEKTRADEAETRANEAERKLKELEKKLQDMKI
jgi:hypothetical protein